MKIKIVPILKAVGRTVGRKAPGILIGAGLGGMLVTVVEAVRATPKAMQSIEAAKAESGKEKLTAAEMVKAAWKQYIPTGIFFAVSTACLIGSAKVSSRRNAALAAACSLSETALREYQEKTREIVGTRKEQSIRDAVNEDRIKKNPPSESQIIITDKGETTCYDPWSGRYFKYDIEKLRRAYENLTYQLWGDTFVCLNEFYDLIDLDGTEPGEILGWSADDGPILPSFTSVLGANDIPYLAIGFNKNPHYSLYK